MWLPCQSKTALVWLQMIFALETEWIPAPRCRLHVGLNKSMQEFAVLMLIDMFCTPSTVEGMVTLYFNLNYSNCASAQSDILGIHHIQQTKHRTIKDKTNIKRTVLWRWCFKAVRWFNNSKWKSPKPQTQQRRHRREGLNSEDMYLGM